MSCLNFIHPLKLSKLCKSRALFIYPMTLSRNEAAAIVVIVAVVAAAWFFYRTSPWVLSDIHGQTHEAEFGGVSLRIEYAMTPGERERGLGGRNEVSSDYGMLFIFPKDGLYGFWMKDTLVPLDIFWLDAQGHVVYVAADVATSTYPSVLYPTVPARYVLETAAGFARAHGIATGTPLLLQKFPDVSQ